MRIIVFFMTMHQCMSWQAIHSLFQDLGIAIEIQRRGFSTLVLFIIIAINYC